MTADEVVETVASMPSEDWLKIQAGIAEMFTARFSTDEVSEIRVALAEADAEFARGGRPDRRGSPSSIRVGVRFRVEYAPRSVRDSARIRAYIVKESNSHETADRFMARLLDACDALHTLPERFPRYPYARD